MAINKNQFTGKIKINLNYLTLNYGNEDAASITRSALIIQNSHADRKTLCLISNLELEIG